MEQTAHENYCTMLELAETLVREAGMSFRQAHDTNRTLVKVPVAEGRSADDLILELRNHGRSGLRPNDWNFRSYIQGSDRPGRKRRTARCQRRNGAKLCSD
jgi:hypothetical protein